MKNGRTVSPMEWQMTSVFDASVLLRDALSGARGVDRKDEIRTVSKLAAQWFVVKLWHGRHDVA